MKAFGRSIALVIALVPLSFARTPRADAQEAGSGAITGSRAFAAEALGGTVGSAVGLAVGLAVARPDDCPSSDDIPCTLRRLGAVGVAGVAGATVGTVVAGRMAGSSPSVVGAFLGAAAGAVAGVALEHFVTEEMNRSIGNVGTLVLFSVTQGILAAAGSRLVVKLRRD